MQKKFVFGILTGIVLLALFVRLFNLSSVPPSPYLDEVSNGYNSYSLLKTGNDEYGKHLPLLMQAYNDGRPTLFVYLMTPFIQLFGLNLFAIRLPAVLLSILATVSVFFLTREFLYSQDKKRERFAVITGLIATLFYAISPWNIYSSRVADEINMSVSFFVFGLTFLLYALNRKLKTLPYLLSVVCMVIAFYSYHGIKFFLPFFVVGIIIIFFKEFLAKKKVALLGVGLGIVLLIPLMIAFLQPGATQRLGGVNKVDPTLVARSAQRGLLNESNNDVLGKIFDNRRVAFSLDFANNYLRNFAPNWLFLQQGNRTFLVPDFGPLSHYALPLIIFGIAFLIRDNTLRPRYKALFMLWLFASVLPAAVSSESPHLNRPNTIFPAWIVLQAIGFSWMLVWIAKFRNAFIKAGAYLVSCAVILVSFLWFWHAYFGLFPYEQAKRYQYSVTDAFTYMKEIENGYEKIIISNGDTLLMSYMYYLFATKYDPATYQQQGGTKSAFFTDTHLIGKYDFRGPNLYEPTIDADDKRQQIKVLYLTNPGEVSETIIKNEELKILRKYYFLDGTESLWLMEGTIQKNT
jgi:4-amino-4-deoxy-L-arabinose transferase-like glycosyltransferase